MVKRQYRIVVAAISVFVSLAGLMGVLSGMLFDDTASLRVGAAALILGTTGFVVMLNPTSKGEE